MLRVTARKKLVLEQGGDVKLAARRYVLFRTCPTYFCTFPLSTLRLLLRPVPLHLGQPLHVDGRLLALVLGRQALQQLDGVRQVVVDRLARRLEVDATDLGERRGGVGRALLQRFQRDEAGRGLGHVSALRCRRRRLRKSSRPRVLRTSSGRTQARRAICTPQRRRSSAVDRMRVGRDDQRHAALAREPRVRVVEIQTLGLAVDLHRHAALAGGSDDRGHVHRVPARA